MSYTKYSINCCVFGCYNTKHTEGKLEKLSFYRIPEDEVRRNEWLHLIGREDLKGNDSHIRSRKVCEEHFAPEDIVITDKRKFLHKYAKPSLKLSGTPDELSSSKLTQSGNDYTVQTQSYNNSSDVDKHNAEEENTFYEICGTYLTTELAQLLKMNRNLRCTSKTNEKEYLNFCINLYQTSPQAYQMFQNILNVPSLTKLLNRFVHIETKLNNEFLELMKSRIHKMTAMERNCSVIIGFVNIKTNLCYNIESDKIYGLHDINGMQYPESAGRAIVVMIRGVYSDWKQPFAHAFLPKYGNNINIVKWIDSILNTLFDVGLIVRTLVHNIKDDIMNLRNDIVSLEKPYFTFNSYTIYYIYDVADLIISLRDSLFVNDFQFDVNSVAKYEYIVKYFNEDLKKTIPVSTKLTTSHICPNKNEKKEIKYASQLFSKNVANGLWNYIFFKYIEEEGRGTAKFITDINNLYNMLNVSNRKHGENEFKKEFGTKYQKEFLKHMIDFFENLHVTDSKNKKDMTSTSKFIQGFLVTIRSTLLLFDDLKKEGYSFLQTGNLQRKALTSFLEEIFETENSTSLTCLKFTLAYKKCFLSCLKKLTLKGDSIKPEDEIKKFACRSDMLETYIREESKVNTDKSKVSNTRMLQICESSDEPTRVNTQDYKDIPENCSLIYVCGHILKRTKDIHKNCLNFQRYMQEYNNSTKRKSHTTYQRSKDYMKKNPDSALPAVPCDDFVKFVEKMDVVFHKAFETVIASPTAKHILECFDNEFPAPCICFPTMYVMNLFIRIKIFYAIRRHNRAMRSKKVQLRNPFVVHRLL